MVCSVCVMRLIWGVLCLLGCAFVLLVLVLLLFFALVYLFLLSILIFTHYGEATKPIFRVDALFHFFLDYLFVFFQ